MIDSVAAASGSLARSAALPVTARLTDVIVDAVTGTVSCAWSCRGADFESTVPRSHEDVPAALPQPKLKPGAPPLAGVACSLMLASGTIPPVDQALTVHCAACPRSLLACARAISTQRLTGVVCDTVLAPLCEAVPVGVGVDVPDEVTFAVAFVVGVAVAFGVVALGVTLALAVALAVVALVVVAALVVVGVADGASDAFVVVFAGGVFVAVFGAVAAGLDFSVRVGSAVALADAVPGSEALPLALAVVVAALVVVVVVAGAALVVVVAGVAVGVVGVAVGLVGVAVGVVGVGVGVGEVGVGEGDGLGGATGGDSGSHDSPLAVVAVLATAVLAARVRLAPEASRTLPAISVTVAGRACPKRMKRPISTARRGMPAIRHQAPRKVPSALPYPVERRDHCEAVIKTRFLERCQA